MAGPVTLPNACRVLRTHIGRTVTCSRGELGVAASCAKPERMSEQKKEVVVEASAAEAKMRFAIWMAKNSTRATTLRASDIEIGTVQTADGKDLVRYKVPPANTDRTGV